MSTELPVSRFGVVEPKALPDDLRGRIEKIAEKSGFVPNVFRALARRPAELRAFMDQVAANPYGVALEPRQRAIVDLALQVATDSASLREDELDAARDAGLTDDEIWDVGAITALFAMSNRLAHLTALRPNPEFYLMGRLPRDGR